MQILGGVVGEWIRKKDLCTFVGGTEWKAGHRGSAVGGDGCACAFCKMAGEGPDPLHAHYGVVGLGLGGCP